MLKNRDKRRERERETTREREREREAWRRNEKLETLVCKGKV